MNNEHQQPNYVAKAAESHFQKSSTSFRRVPNASRIIFNKKFQEKNVLHITSRANHTNIVPQGLDPYLRKLNVKKMLNLVQSSPLKK